VEFTALNVIGLIVLGLLAGIAGGLLGIGGGVINIPGLTLIFLVVNPLARSATLVVNTLIGLSSALRHRKAGCVLRRVVGLMLVGGLVGGVVGAVAAHRLDRWRWIFPGIFAAFLVYVIAANLKRLLQRGRDEERQFASDQPYPLTSQRVVGLIWVGFPMGLLAGLLGIGGGAVAVPMQQTVARMPLRNAIACSSAAIVGTCTAAAAAAILAEMTASDPAFSWWQPLAIAGILIPSAVLGAQIGAHLTHTLPLRVVRAVFVLVILVSCVKMAQRSIELYRLSHRPSATQEVNTP